MPELWKVKGLVTPGVFRVEGTLTRTRKVATSTLLSPCDVRTRASVSEDEYRQLKLKCEAQTAQLTQAKEMELTELDELRGENIHLKDALQEQRDEFQNEKRAWEEQRDELENDIGDLRDAQTAHFQEVLKLRAEIRKQKLTIENEQRKARVSAKALADMRKKSVLERPMTLYEILYVNPDADTATITKHYRKLVLLVHPDQGGDESQFKMINKAHELLTCDNARIVYDLLGFEAAEEELKRQREADTPMQF